MMKMLADMFNMNHNVFSGAMDIIAIKNKEGKIESTPFHVRFGTFKILKAKEKIVDVYVNGHKTKLKMKLSSAGDAYFTSDSIELKEDYKEEEISEKVTEVNIKCDIPDEKDETELFDPSIDEHLADPNDIKSVPALMVKEAKFITEKEQKHFVLKLNKSIILSNCHDELLKNLDKAEEIFIEKSINKEEFFKDPWKVMNNPNLVILFGESLYSYKVAAPLLFSLMAYGESLPEEVIKSLSLLETGFLSHFRSKRPDEITKIRLKHFESEELALKLEGIHKTKRKHSLKTKYKSFKPTSLQLELLNLQDGANVIEFVCKSRFSGTQKLTAEIYLWPSECKLVVSDVDGTITKSDVLGHIMPMIGKDWSHSGVTDLYTSIERNGYKIIYLTARALCQSSTTKNYLQSLFQEQKGLPRGPLLTSPDGLISSFKREVINRTPQIFKITCLTEVKELFPEDYFPFYSGFGNRASDAVSYRSVGIEMSRIFIINEKGEVVQLNNSFKKTYSLLNEIIQDLFPKLGIS